MRPAILVLLVAVAVPLAGCGKSDEEQVRGALAQYAAATREKDYQRLCDDLLASQLVQSVRSLGLPCEAVLRHSLGQVSHPTLTVSSVQVAENQALARVRTDAANQRPSDDTIRLVHQDGSWRIASLASPQPQPPPDNVP
ncbi:MAG: nuclear transport factor 2 family protein [Actinomycetota bacterium]|nr:nuclear transport factor 2 family protein [Actinomycetota bacterium]